MADESRPLLPHKDIASKSSDGAHDAHEENPKSLDTLSVVIALIGGLICCLGIGAAVDGASL